MENVRKLTIALFAVTLSVVFSTVPSPASAQVDYTGSKRGVVKIIAHKPGDGQDTGAGIVVDIDIDNNVALILTAYHVIRGAQKIEVMFSDKRYVKFTGNPFERYQEELDIALIIVDSEKGKKVPHDLPDFTRGDDLKLQEHERVSTIGHPLDMEWQVSRHDIAKLSVQEDFRKFRFMKPGIERGSSGGPIFNDQGALIGMVTTVDAGLHAIGVKISNILSVLEVSWGIQTGKLTRPLVFGTIVVNSEPTDAQVFLDGRRIGATTAGPLAIKDLEARRYTLRVAKEGYTPWEQSVDVEPKKERSIMARLEPVALSRAFGTIVVNSEPTDAQVFLDGRRIGATTAGPLAIKDLEARRYTLRVAKEGYTPWEQSVDVEPKKERSIMARLEPAPSPPPKRESLDGFWSLRWDNDESAYEGVLYMNGPSGILRVKYVNDLTGRHESVDQTVELQRHSQGLLLVGSNPVYTGTGNEAPFYAADNFLFQKQSDGSWIVETCDNAKKCADVDAKFISLNR